jgi:hypothetical protein
VVVTRYRIVRPIERPARLFKTAGFRFRVVGWRNGFPVVQPTNIPKRLLDRVGKLITLDRNYIVNGKGEVIN